LVFCWATIKPRSVGCDCFVLLPGRCCKLLRQPNPSAHCTTLSRNISLQPNTAVCRPALQCTQEYFPRSARGALQSGPREQRPFDGLLPSFMSKTGGYGFKTEWFSKSIRLTACDDFPAIHPRPLLLDATALKVLRCSTKSTGKSPDWRLGSRLNWGTVLLSFMFKVAVI
jgi:hypothetical protein